MLLRQQRGQFGYHGLEMRKNLVGHSLSLFVASVVENPQGIVRHSLRLEVLLQAYVRMRAKHQCKALTTRVTAIAEKPGSILSGAERVLRALCHDEQLRECFCRAREVSLVLQLQRQRHRLSRGPLSLRPSSADGSRWSERLALLQSGLGHVRLGEKEHNLDLNFCKAELPEKSPCALSGFHGFVKQPRGQEHLCRHMLRMSLSLGIPAIAEHPNGVLGSGQRLLKTILRVVHLRKGHEGRRRLRRRTKLFKMCSPLLGCLQCLLAHPLSQLRLDDLVHGRRLLLRVP
mmetsp:Transcript_18578/g.49913  ORF Transcript_18578/g.49913 Transcript_18578/m.49913 type:complete len:288 (+) Transcript_18578:641-1504(+)